MERVNILCETTNLSSRRDRRCQSLASLLPSIPEEDSDTDGEGSQSSKNTAKNLGSQTCLLWSPDPAKVNDHITHYACGC